MLNHRQELEKIAAEKESKSFVHIQRMYDDLAEQLKERQQYEDACDVLYVKLVDLFNYRLLVQALDVLTANRAFFNEYANYYLLLCARSAAITILD